MVFANLNQFILVFADGTAYLITSMFLHHLWLALLHCFEKKLWRNGFRKRSAMIRVIIGTLLLSQREAFFGEVGLPGGSQDGMKNASCGDESLDLCPAR